MMKILFQSRTTLFTVPGGDTTQMLMTKEYLEKLGVTVDISTELEPDASNYDIVHAFNLVRPQEVYLQLRNAKRYRKPTALSTVYCTNDEYDLKARTGIPGVFARLLGPQRFEYAKVAARMLVNGELNKGTLNYFRYGHRSLQKQICDMVDMYLPNSESEMHRVIADMKLTRYDYVVVPNAMDANLYRYDSCVVPDELQQFKDCILCVARIEGRKNQLNLVRAVKGLPWKLVLIGQPAPNHVDYYRKIQKEAGSNVVILGYLPLEKLPAYYKIAKVHVLASWMETTGLSSLEAGAMGCNLVITDKGDTRDYFGNDAFYCEPDSVESMRVAIIKAHQCAKNLALRERIVKDYRWERTAERTYDGYRKVLKEHF